MVPIGLVFLITKAATGGYVLIASVTALLLLLCCRVFNRLTYRLFIYVLSATILLSLAIEFDTATVGTLSYQRASSFNLNVGDQVISTLCRVTGALIHYAICLDILVIFWSALWLVRLARREDWKKGAVEDGKKTKQKQKIWELAGLLLLLLLPGLAVIAPIVLSLYDAEGPWCHIRLAQANVTTDGSGMADERYRDISGILVSLLTLYIPALVLLLISVVLIVYTMVKVLIRIKSLDFIIPEMHINLLKDGMVLGVLVFIFIFTYCIWIGGYMYRLATLDNNQILWFIEVAVFAIRGAAIFCIIFNPKTFARIRKAKKAAAQLHTVSERNNALHERSTVEGSFALQEVAEEDNENRNIHIRALPTRGQV